MNSNFAAVSQGPSGEWKGGCDVGADFGGCGMVGERMAVWPFPLFLSRWRLGTPADRAGRVDVWGGFEMAVPLALGERILTVLSGFPPCCKTYTKKLLGLFKLV